MGEIAVGEMNSEIGREVTIKCMNAAIVTILSPLIITNDVFIIS
ncbi:hypothetical protein [Bacteroides thetaiotaomicron]|nr:hypothetical protein [Bacteroides thetaiotaomicron]